MIKQQSDDPDVFAAARHAASLVQEVLAGLPPAQSFDYGGHTLHLGEYGMCQRCTLPIAEAQQASRAVLDKADAVTDPTVREHLELAAELFRTEAAAAEIRAEFHNGHGSEAILNSVLAFVHDRSIGDSYDHSHDGGN